MIRSTITLATLALTIGCSTTSIPTKSPFESEDAAECLDTATSDTGIETVGDSPVTDSDTTTETEPTEEYPTCATCEVTLRWGAQYTETTISEFQLPSLTVASTCALEIGLRGIGLKVMGGAWIGQLPDTRLGIGDGDIQPLGVYDGTISEYGIKAEWSANVNAYSVYFNPTRPVDIGLNLAAFASWPEEMAAIDELNDATPDTISVQATIVYNADGQAGGALVDTTTMVIFPE